MMYVAELQTQMLPYSIGFCGLRDEDWNIKTLHTNSQKMVINLL